MSNETLVGDLKACPFCGKTETAEIITGQELMDEEQEFWEHSDSYAVVCNAANPNGKGGCGAMGGFALTKEGAIELWNRREPDRKEEQMPYVLLPPPSVEKMMTEFANWMAQHARAKITVRLDYRDGTYSVTEFDSRDRYVR